MAATRVRLVAEFRNGDGNFLIKEFDPEKWVKCSGTHDAKALEAAFLVLAERVKVLSQMRKEYEAHRKPGHD